MGFGVTTHAFPNASNDMNEDFGTMDNDEWECVQSKHLIFYCLKLNNSMYLE